MGMAKPMRQAKYSKTATAFFHRLLNIGLCASDSEQFHQSGGDGRACARGKPKPIATRICIQDIFFQSWFGI